MRTFTTVCCHWYDQWRKEFTCSVTALVSLMVLSSFFATQTFAQSLNLDQGANGAYTDPLSVRDPVKWQNGNLNQQQSHLIEGHSVPYRLIVGNLTPGQQYTITLGYDMVNSSKYALDFITGYDNLQPHTFTSTGGHTQAEHIYPYGDGTAYVAPTDNMDITLPAYLIENATNIAAAPAGAIVKVNDYWDNLPGSAKQISIWGGTFNKTYGIQYAYYENSAPISATEILDLAKGETKVQFTIKFTASSTQATIAWGGHIANRLQWSYNSLGEPNSAGGLSGSPYHMRTITGGNQDRSLKVALAGPICPTDLPVNAVSLCANSSYVNLPLGQCPNNVCVGTPLYFNIPLQSGALTYAWTVTKDGNPTVVASGTSAQFTFTPSSGGVYTVSVVLGNNSGFQATCSQTITVITVDAYPASKTLCETSAGVGTASFDLTALEATVKGSQTGVTGVTWYTDAALTSPITTPASYTSGSTTVYAKVSKGECYASSAVTLTVKPLPVVTQLANMGLCAGANSSGITFGSNVTGTSYAWTSTGDIGFGTTGTGNIGAFTAVNSGTTPITTTVSVIGTAGTEPACQGPAMTFTITVNPTPTVNEVDDQTLCASTSTMAVTFSGTATSFNWVNNTPSIGLAASGTGNIRSFTAVNNGTTPITATITVTPVYSNAGVACEGTPMTFTITVNPAPTVNEVANRVHCNGDNGTMISFGANIASASFSWTSSTNVGFGTSGTGDIPAYTAMNNTTTPITATVSVTATANGCSGPARTFTVTVLPTPTVNQPSNQSVCNGAPTTAITFSGTATGFNWTNNTPGIGLAASGSGNIASFTAVNNGNTPVVATITVTPEYVYSGKTCTGAPQTFTITVNPTPTVNTIGDAAYCNGEASAAIDFSSNVDGASFSWTSSANVGFGTSGTGDISAYTATNSTTAPVTATISVRASANGCEGPARTFMVTVLPTPTVEQPASQVVCNGSMTNAIAFTGTATAFNWSNNTTSIGLGASGTGTIGAFAAVNTGTSPVTATITVTPVYTVGDKTCTGASKSFTITVNPTPTVNTVSNQLVCNGDNTTGITFSGAVAGTVYNWTNNTPSIGMAASGSGNIAAFSAVNTGTAPVIATITVTPGYSNGGRTCEGTPTSFTITVNPTPTVNTIANRSYCPGDAASAIIFGSNVAGATFSWTSDVNLGFGLSGTGNFPAFTATNATTSPIVATVSVRATAYGCPGPISTFTVTVNPKPVLVITNPPQACMPNTVDITASSVTAGSNLLGGTVTYWMDAAATMPLSNPNAVAVGGTYYIKATTGAGCFDIQPVTVTIIQCTYCTYTQGYYGNAGGKACIGEPGTKLSTIGLIQHSLDAWGGTMRIGTASRFVDIPYAQASKVIDFLPGGGGSYSFAQAVKDKPAHINGTIGDPNFQLRYTKKAGKNYRIDNTLLAQTITLGLNMGIRSDLDELALQGNKYLVTVDPLNGCGTTVAKTCTWDATTGTWIDPHTYKWIDGDVVNAISGAKTVGGLFNLANRALAGENVGISLDKIAGVVDAINNAFDECKLMVGYSDTKSACQTPSTYTVSTQTNVREAVAPEHSADHLNVTASPNPYNDNVWFTIESPVSGQGSLEVYNLVGQKLATVYQGFIMAGRGQSIEYKVAPAHRTTLIYVLKVGGQQVTGKLINQK